MWGFGESVRTIRQLYIVIVVYKGHFPAPIRLFWVYRLSMFEKIEGFWPMRSLLSKKHFDQLVGSSLKT